MQEVFLNHPTVKEAVQEAGHLRASGHRFSDVVDDEGHQYADLVQEGGGVLGIALVGYVYVAEQAGLRFYSLAGTSAGSINTLLMAARGPVGQPVARDILQALSQKDLSDFMDGPGKINRLLQKTLRKEKGLVWSLIFNARKLILRLKNHQGINPGDSLERWLEQLLAESGVRSGADLQELREVPAGLKMRPGVEGSISPARLAIVASEINTHTKVDFPRMAPLYWSDPDKLHPARYVRASMAVPYFFEPLRISSLPRGESVRERWQEWAGYRGEIPEEVSFVDGGLLSNFPIQIFHRQEGIPTRPTFGVRLSTFRKEYSRTDSFMGMSGAMISTMRQIHDYDFLLRNPDYRQLICNIEADRDFNWLNFDMPRERQVELFALGAARAINFLKGFRWEDYKKTRQDILAVRANN